MLFFKYQNKRGQNEPKSRRVLGWLVWGLGLVMCWSLWGGVRKIKEGYRRLELAEQELNLRRGEREVILKKKEMVESGLYLEGIIRDDLRMQKDGEVVVVLPGESNYRVDPSDENTRVEDRRENWQKWWGLVSG